MHGLLKYSGLIILVAITGACTGACSSGPGQDAISTRQQAVVSPQCTVNCHTGVLALDPLLTNGTGTAGKHVVHVTSRSIPCERCHNAYLRKPTHMNGTLDTPDPAAQLVFFDATNPNGLWTKTSGSAIVGQCSLLDCHGSSTILQWYSANTWTTPTDCRVCHGAPAGTRRQVLAAGSSSGSGGDFNQESHHVISYASRTSEIVSVPGDCAVCHEMALHMSGTIRLNNKDIAANQIITYETGTPSSLEPFCLSCHDTDGVTTDSTGTTPFSDGNTLGAGLNVAGTRIKDYWNGASSTHKSRGLTCAGTGAPGTGCHGSSGAINMHGSTAKGLLTNILTLPVPSTAAFSYNNYKLCFDCHASYPGVAKEVVLGVRQGGHYDTARAPIPYYTSSIQSLFRERYIALPANYPSYWSGVNQTYNDTVFGDPYLPLHNYHLLSTETDTLVPGIDNFLTWKYRGDPAQTGRISCVTCHNVHGTNGLSARSTFDEFGITTAITGTVPPPAGPDLYKTMPFFNYNATVMQSYPMNCAVDCHGKAGLTHYWYSPADE